MSRSYDVVTVKILSKALSMQFVIRKILFILAYIMQKTWVFLIRDKIFLRMKIIN